MENRKPEKNKAGMRVVKEELKGDDVCRYKTCLVSGIAEGELRRANS
ncbi:hypothetical protein [Pollutibacter soli]